MLKGISALDKWLARSTWHTGHPIDMGIFYSDLDPPFPDSFCILS
ncbi:hypothetical protein ACOY9O_14975 [Enterobacter asburiae]